MKKKLPILKIILVLALLAALIAGCARTQNVNDRPGKDELILAVRGESETGYDPTSGWGRYGSPLFQSTLLKRDNDLKVVNDLAVKYEISDNGLIWTVTIRNDAKFSDGKPVTAADVAYTFETAAKSGSVIDLTIMESAKAVGDHAVVFTLKRPQSTFVNLLITTGIVPRHAHGKGYAENPVGSGPYKMAQWDRGQQMIVEANSDYYGPKPFFKKITFLFLDEDAAFAAAKAGKTDVAAVPQSFAGQKVQGMRLLAVKSVDNRGISFPVAPSGRKSQDGYPVGNDVTADIAVRKAFNIAVDRKALVEGVLQGFGSPAYTACDNLAWWNPETVIKDADRESAGKLLADAGWKDTDGDGVLEKGSLEARFTLIYPAGDQIRQSLALAVADMIKPLGIVVSVEGKSWDDIKTLKHSNAVLFGWGSHDPLEMYNLYSSKTRGVAWYNPGFYSNPSVDDYMDRALAAASEDKAFEYWKKAQWDGKSGLSARGDAPWAWLVNLDHCYFIRDGLNTGRQRIEPHGHGWPITGNITEWRWNE